MFKFENKPGTELSKQPDLLDFLVQSMLLPIAAPELAKTIIVIVEGTELASGFIFIAEKPKIALGICAGWRVYE